MTEFTILAGVALLLSVAVIWILGVLPAGRNTAPTVARPGDCHFLFRGARLVDHDAGDVFAADAGDPAATDWDRVRDWLGFRFADLPPSPGDIAPGETRDFASHLPDDAARLEAHATHATLRLRLCEDTPPSAARLNKIRRAGHTADATLRAVHRAPYPVWIKDAAGHMLWQNAAALALPDADKARLTANLTPPDPGETATGRVAVPVCGDTEAATWFDVTVKRMGGRTGDGQVIFANDISALVAAENAQRSFVNTLGKTFADLPTGLAVFDRAKTLAIFNPALIDLTGLPVEFLSARPEIVTFFDMLRDRQVMPEPKNYASWRGQINEMVSAAHGGHYREMWSLANGRSYRVTGRPHPDGAVAFLFEDISSEISETRTHRGEMALRDALLDTLDAAIAVLSQDRGLILCNRAFRDLLGVDADAPLTEISLADVTQACGARFPDPALWSDIAHRIASNALREPIADSIAPDGAGTGLDLRLAPLGQGRAMLSLHPHETGARHLKTG
ncbi:PAS-domain containing protein [Roseovarius sp. D22-M7]|uniref:PAS-domain containing protein n=1 Tax=Roseovarius sp. D22-M7 TaxID=3127116 RepID=UPI003FA7C3FA